MVKGKGSGSKFVWAREVRVSDTDGSPKLRGVSAAAQLTAANAGSAWDDASSNTLGVWDFDDDMQNPALRYGDYDGPAATFACGQFPAAACCTLLPGHADVRGGVSGGGGSLGLRRLVALGLPLPFGWRRWRWSRSRFIFIIMLSVLS